MTKAPIEPGDIRKGDLIRCEYVDVNYAGNAAVEYYAACDGFYNGSAENSFFLLDRPKPPVVLPTVPGHYLPSYQNPEVHTLDAEGDWLVGNKLVTEAQVKHDCGLGLVKLEPVAETAIQALLLAVKAIEESNTGTTSFKTVHSNSVCREFLKEFGVAR